MVRLTQLLRAVALCLFFHALTSEGVRVSSTPRCEAISKRLGFQSSKKMLASTKSKSFKETFFGKDSSSWGDGYSASHQAPYGGTYYGLQVTMDVYSYNLKPGQYTSTIISVDHTGDGELSSRNAILVGWHINPEYNRDSLPHFYTYWTNDGFYQTGCFNMDCPGFIRAHGAAVAPGDVIKPVSSVPHGPVQNITLKVLKDKRSGDWWVYYGLNSEPIGVGYFPKSLFNCLGEKSDGMQIGGYVNAITTIPTPPMGSGVLPNSVHGRAASFSNLKEFDQDGKSRPITSTSYWDPDVTNQTCHSITAIDHGACLYGGPGGCGR